MKMTAAMLAFNRGIVSSKALARVDLEKLQLAAETQENWMPDVLGPMSLRPGWQYLTSTRNNAAVRGIPFIYAVDDSAILEFSASALRVLIDGEPISRGSVSTAVSNGNFTSNVTSWTDADETGATSQWATGGYLSLTGTGFAAAIRRQQVTVAAADQGDEHALRVVIYKGKVKLKVGSTSGGNEYFEYNLTEGTHSLAFTPTGDFYIELSSVTRYATLVDSINVESAGTMEITTVYDADDLDKIRYDQSADVVFLACSGRQQYRVERRSARSWSVAKYMTEDGPFRDLNLTSVRLTASATTGDITLTASQAFFQTGHAGALFKITSAGQQVTGSLTGDGQFTSEIRVIGTGTQRSFNVVRSGTWSGTLTLQRSVSEPGSWVNVATYTTNATTVYTDGLDNQVIYYRIGFDTGGYVSDTAAVELEYSSGSIDGLVLVDSVTNSTTATARVLRELGGTDASIDWYEGDWSDYRGWPSAVALYEGRLWWAGKTKIWGSVSDAYASFDSDVEGDSGPLNRTIGSGPVDTIGWLLPLQRLLIGTAGSELTAKSSSLDEPLTPTAFSIKDVSTYGSKGVSPLKLDSAGLFVHRGGTRLFELSLANSYDYAPKDLNLITPDVCLAGINRIALQRMPDTRIHAVLSDGTVALLVYEGGESVQAWFKVVTDGDVEDVVVLPDADSDEDQVFYVVNRTIDGSTVRYWEKWAKQTECVGGTVNKQADSFVYYSGTATTAITGLDHLEGESVVVWADGEDVGSHTVSSGQITLATAASDVVAGLSYQARYKSAKLAYIGPSKAGVAVFGGEALTQRKRINSIGLVLENTHAQGLQFGRDFDNLDELPTYELESAVDQDSVWGRYDYDSVPFPGEFQNDARVCLVANAPKPCTVLAAVIGIATHEKG
jgi:hypothetical protein